MRLPASKKGNFIWGFEPIVFALQWTWRDYRVHVKIVWNQNSETIIHTFFTMVTPLLDPTLKMTFLWLPMKVGNQRKSSFFLLNKIESKYQQRTQLFLLKVGKSKTWNWKKWEHCLFTNQMICVLTKELTNCK